MSYTKNKTSQCCNASTDRLHTVDFPPTYQSSVHCSILIFRRTIWTLRHCPWWAFCVILISLTPPPPRPHGLTFTWWGHCGLCLWHKANELAHSFLFCSSVCFCLYGPFSYILFHKFSRQLSAFSLCSPGLISALFFLWTIYLFVKVSLSPDLILCCWFDLKHQLSLSLSPSLSFQNTSSHL